VQLHRNDTVVQAAVAFFLFSALYETRRTVPKGTDGDTYNQLDFPLSDSTLPRVYLTQEGSNMIPLFDIFKTDKNGDVSWLCYAKGLEAAKSNAKRLAAQTPGDYFVLCLATREKLMLKAEGSFQQTPR
jgi:hypothetical protein